jgi:hypothetical protein
MVWRKGNFFGVTFEDQGAPTISEAEVRRSDVTIEAPGFSLLANPQQLAHPDDAEAFTEFASQIAERKSDGGADVRFTVGVAVALGLPVLISLGAYIATTKVLGAG